MFVCLSVVVTSLFLPTFNHPSPLYDVLDHTNHIFSESLSSGGDNDQDKEDLQKDKYKRQRRRDKDKDNDNDKLFIFPNREVIKKRSFYGQADRKSI